MSIIVRDWLVLSMEQKIKLLLIVAKEIKK